MTIHFGCSSPTTSHEVVASALTKAERQKLIPVGDARPLRGRVMRTPPAMHPYEPLLDRAVDISSQTRSGLYDCLYVALAEREGCELVTDDQKLIANLKPHFPFIIPLASLP
jgi:predicted nucleic acid-binding protein